MRSPDPIDPMPDRAMSVRLVSISGRASAEQFGFRSGRAWRTVAISPALWVRWVKVAASAPLVQAGEWKSVGEPVGRAGAAVLPPA
jgi:hypothetical protein